MTWFITHKPAYDMDFVELSKELQKRATQAHAELEKDPVTPRGNTIKPLQGWENLWRYRIGDYRLIYAADPASNLVQLLAIGPRKDVYERFNYPADAAQRSEIAFGPELAAGLTPERKVPEWLSHPEWYQPQREREEAVAQRLPQKLTPGRLHRWRVPDEYHDALMRCLTEEELVAADVPGWVLERVMDALWPPKIAQLARQKDQLLLQPEDLQRYAEGKLHGFLLHLDEAQRRYVDWALSGPTLVKGGPGSGKSTVALYRTKTLVEHALSTSGEVPSVLFTTFTNALTNFSASLLCQLLRDGLGLEGYHLPPAVQVTTVDKVAMSIVRRAQGWVRPADRDARREALHYARTAGRQPALDGLEALLSVGALQNLRDSYLLEEFTWVIEGQNCRTLEDYLDAQRAGRGVPFGRSLRERVWDLYEAYVDHLERQGLVTWGQLRQLALALVQKGRFEQRWDYVIVDEAQDLTPVALALCVELCRDPAGLFLTADANQSLYNRGFRWKNVHEQLQVQGRTRILRRNYRSTRQIAIAAGDLLRGMEEADSEAAQQDFVHAGPLPVIYAAEGTADQARWLTESLWLAAQELRLPINSAAVLVPTNHLAENLAGLLKGRGLPARYVRSQEVRLEERCVKVMTLHAAKGLEFPIVAIAHVEADRLPRDSQATDPEEIKEHLYDQRRLFYVGCTRAMRHLFVTYDRSLPSPFIDLLTDDHWLKLA
ncbi:MAG: 3'-5' exonuclease [Anaerolineae bacterium]